MHALTTTRRNLLWMATTTTTTTSSKRPTKSPISSPPPPANNDENDDFSARVLVPDVVYVYRQKRFRALFRISAEPDDASCVTVRRRVDWYDPVTDTTRADVASDTYVVDYETI